MSQPGGAGPFAALGLPARPGLTDDEVRAAWRRVAAATHPDRADGGDPARFTAAAAAYTALRTQSGRGEALASLAGPALWDGPATTGGGPSRARPGGRALTSLAVLLARVRRGRPAVLLARLAVVAAVTAVAVSAVGWAPASAAALAGAVTWLVLTTRHDLAPGRWVRDRPAAAAARAGRRW